jgi:TolB-like protein/Tfp pilus assembly protein PilF
MFTDIVGYAAISHQNEPLALKLLEEHRLLIRPIFLQFGGKEIKTIGDAFLTEFESALEATRCAIQIQSTLQNINSDRTDRETIWLRIGIHLGDIVYKDGDVYGDGVNITARLLFYCKPGGVCLSQYVFDQIDNKLNVKIKKLGVRPLKNISKPINIYLIDLKGRTYIKPSVQSVKNQSLRYLQFTVAALAIIITPYFWNTHLAKIKTGNQTVLIDDPAINKGSVYTRIAVLPFVNINGTKSDDFWSDGLTEELISQLSKLQSLRVLARTSTTQYKNLNKNAVEIGHELKVGALVEGSVRTSKNKIRIHVQLTNAVTQENVWSYDYDGNINEIFKTQKTIALQITEHFRQRSLANIENTGDLHLYTPAHEAYVNYLRGRYFMNKRTEDTLYKAIDFFQKAIKIDSKFAAASGAIANCYSLLHYYEAISPSDAIQKMQKYIDHALKLDPNLPEALISLAEKKAYYDYAWDEADELFKKAIKVSPANSRVRQWYGEFLTTQENFAQAKIEFTQALELDPLSLTASTAMALPDFYERNYKKSIQQYLNTVEMDPNFLLPYYWMAKAYLGDKKNSQAVEALKKAAEISKNSPKVIAELGYAYALSKNFKQSKSILETLKKLSKEKYVSPYLFARIYLGMDDKKQTMEWLKRAVDEKALPVAFIKIDPSFDKLRQDPEFIELLKNTGLNAARLPIAQ